MTWEPRPMPNVTPETEPFWSAAADEDLLLCECNNCSLTYYYPRSLCPDCLSEDISHKTATGRGTVYAHSSMDSIEGWPKEDLPLVLAYVELDEGPRLMTNLADCDPEKVTVGMPVEVEFIPTKDEDIAVPRFRPLEK